MQELSRIPRVAELRLQTKTHEKALPLEIFTCKKLEVEIEYIIDRNEDELEEILKFKCVHISSHKNDDENYGKLKKSIFDQIKNSDEIICISPILFYKCIYGEQLVLKPCMSEDSFIAKFKRPLVYSCRLIEYNEHEDSFTLHVC